MDKELLDIGPTADELPEAPKTELPKVPASTSKAKSSKSLMHFRFIVFPSFLTFAHFAFDSVLEKEEEDEDILREMQSWAS